MDYETQESEEAEQPVPPPVTGKDLDTITAFVVIAGGSIFGLVVIGIGWAVYLSGGHS